MSDYLAKAALQKIISMTSPEELRDWCKLLGCTAAQLREAVDHASTTPEEVRQFLRAKKRRERRLRG